jgi:hypothetical protein
MSSMLLTNAKSVVPSFISRKSGDGRRRNLRVKICLLIALAALLGLSTPAHAGYAFPTTPAQMISSFEAFVGDFSAWNGRMNNQPMMELASTPSDQTTNMVLMLWLEWLQGMGSPASKPSPSSLQSASGSGTPESPGSGNGVMGNNPLGGSPVGLGASESPLGSPSQGTSGPSSGNGGVIGGPVNGGHVGSFQATNPEPASLTMLGTGFFAFLTYGYARRRAARRASVQD